MPRHFVVNGQPRHLNGWRPQKPDPRDRVFRPGLIAQLKQPDSVDIRPQLNLTIENQGSLGACTCEATTSAMEATLHKEGQDVQLSELWLYDKSRWYEGTPLSEDSGCEIRDVVQVAALFGCPLKTSWPFDPTIPSTEPPESLETEAAKHRVLFYYACESDRATRASLLQGFPVIAGFNVPAHMMSDEVAQTGLVHHMTDNEGYVGGHAILIVGYDNKKMIGPDQGGWLCANSWGTGWGLSGFFWLSFQCMPRDRWTLRRI